MKTTLVIASIAIIGAVGQAVAISADMPGPSYAFTLVAGDDTASVWNGRWEGTTVSGHPLVLELQLQGQRITGRLVVGKQSAKIIYGKVVVDAFALTTGPIDGHSVDATGRRVGDAIELKIEGVKDPVTLTRAK